MPRFSFSSLPPLLQGGGRHIEAPSFLEVVDAVFPGRDLAREKAHTPVYLLFHLVGGNHSGRHGYGVLTVPVDEEDGRDDGDAEKIREGLFPGDVDPLDLPAVL